MSIFHRLTTQKLRSVSTTNPKSSTSPLAVMPYSSSWSDSSSDSSSDPSSDSSSNSWSVSKTSACCLTILATASFNQASASRETSSDWEYSGTVPASVCGSESCFTTGSSCDSGCDCASRYDSMFEASEAR